MLIVANWKAYVEDTDKAKKLVAVSKKLARDSKHQIVLAPPAPLLGLLAQKNTSSVAFAVQDVSVAVGGAHTGEVTAAAAAAAGTTYAIVGHSECRARGDTDAIVAEKVVRALAPGLRPILCVGERERDGEGRYLTVIREEITAALSPLQQNERAGIIIAYEPLWAIGKSAAESITTSDLSEMTLYIRKVLAEHLPGKSASRSLVIYGGAVEGGNAASLATAGIDGFLVGHASVDPKAFADIVRELP